MCEAAIIDRHPRLTLLVAPTICPHRLLFTLPAKNYRCWEHPLGDAQQFAFVQEPHHMDTFRPSRPERAGSCWTSTI
jgi:hypothetical protein